MSTVGTADAAGAAIGIDVGGTKVLAVLVDRDGAVLATARRSSQGSAEDVWTAMVDAAVELGAAPGTAVGVGFPGLVGLDGHFAVGPNILQVSDVAIGPLISARLGGAPVRVDNDANCAALGEWAFGAARHSDNACVVTLGTGVGAGMIVGGRVVRGATGYAGEAGHMVVDPSGPACPCGKRGCWERYASGNGLGWLGREAATAGDAPALVAAAGSIEAITGEHVTALAAEGEAGAVGVLDTYASWVALGLGNLVEILDADTFVLGGGVAESAELFLERVRAALPDHVAGSGRRPRPDVVVAALGERAGAIGAAVLAREP